MPGHLAAFHQLLEHLLVLERVHGAPETVVAVRHELIALDQAVERFEHEFLAIADIFEDLSAKNEVSAVDPDVGVRAGAEAENRAGVVELGEMEAERRLHRNEASDLAALPESLDHVRQRCVSQSIAVV